MLIDLADKTAIVTGSTAGIGLAIAHGLAHAGASVVVNGRTEERVHSAVAQLRSAYPDANIRGVAADLSTASGCEKLVSAEPHADILVNNLGIFEAVDFFEIPNQDWQKFFDVNVLSGVRVSRAYAPGMVDNGWGRIVFLSSESGINIPTEMIHYGFTKSANLSVSRGLAKRLALPGIGGHHARANPVRRRHGHDRAIGQTARRQHRGRGTGFRSGQAAIVDYPARRHPRRGRQHGGLCLLAAGLGHHWCGNAG